MDEIFLNSLMTYVPDLIAERVVLFKVRRGEGGTEGVTKKGLCFNFESGYLLRLDA